MPISTKTATATLALIIGAGAYPLAATAQTDENQQVEVEVIESGEAAEGAEQAAEETGQAVQEGAAETGQALEQAAEETGQVIEEGAEATGQALEETGEAVEQTAEGAGEAVEVDVSGAEDLDETQKQELEQAAAEGKPVPRPEMIIGVQKEGEWLTSELIDREVANRNDEDIGDISAILFTEQGPKGVIVDVGGFLGMGEKEVALKWEELSIEQEAILVDASKEALENAPEFITLEEKRSQAELQAQQEAAEAEQQTAQQTETMAPAPETEGMATEPAEGEVEVEGVETTQ